MFDSKNKSTTFSKNSEVTHLSNYLCKSMEIPFVMVSDLGYYRIFYNFFN